MKTLQFLIFKELESVGVNTEQICLGTGRMEVRECFREVWMFDVSL